MLLFQASSPMAIRCFVDDGDEPASFSALRNMYARLRLFWAHVPGGCVGLRGAVQPMITRRDLEAHKEFRIWEHSD